MNFSEYESLEEAKSYQNGCDHVTANTSPFENGGFGRCKTKEIQALEKTSRSKKWVSF
jgi:hypothetical protein